MEIFRKATLPLAVALAALLAPALAGATVAPLAVLPDGSLPMAMVTDSSGNIYTANSGTNSISRITPAGLVTKFADTGLSPRGITIDSSGNLYTANFGSNTVTRVTPDGVATAAWATTGANPWGITIAAANVQAGNLLVANSGSRSVTSITPEGVSSTLNAAQTGVEPREIASDSLGRTYTANYGSGTVTRIGPSGNTSASWASSGATPTGLATDSSPNLYVASLGNTVKKFNAGSATSSLAWTATGNLDQPRSLVRDAAGNLYAANSASDTVTKIAPDGATTGLFATLTDGTDPRAMTISRDCLIVVASYTNNSVYAVPLGPPCPPPAPTAVAGDGQATVTVAAGDGATPASFTVTSAPGDKTCTVTGSFGSCTVTGLDNGTDYAFRASATNESGTSALSPASNTVRPTVPAPGTPPAPSAVAGDGSATITVTAGSGGPPESYNVTSTGGGHGCTVTGTSGSCTVTGLSNGTGYAFTAVATNPGGTSDPSPPSETVVPASATPPDPGPSPDPGPDPFPRAFTAEPGTPVVTRRAVVIATAGQVPGQGKVEQVASTRGPSSKPTTLCRANVATVAADGYTLACRIGSSGRNLLRKRSVRLAIRTTFTPADGGVPVTAVKRLLLKRSP